MVKETQQGVHVVDYFGNEVLAAFSGRAYDASRRNEFLKEIGVHPENLVLLNQVHSANLVLVSKEKRPEPECKADGMLTKTPGLTLGILTADCVPVFFYDPEHKVVGIAHAGWRGIYHGISKKMIQAFRQNFLSSPQTMKIIIGPAIRKCCYEVGAEFADFFPDFYRSRKNGKGQNGGAGRMDLIAAVQADLTSEGISADHIFDTDLCTACNQDRFFSYRKEATQERILSVVSFRGPN